MARRTPPLQVLVAIPYRTSTPPALLTQCRGLVAAMVAANPAMHFAIAEYPNQPQGREGDTRYSAHARARNALLDTHLQPHHESVLWLDVDLIAWPADLPTRLWAVAQGGIAAPAILYDRHYRRFYDIGGFIEAGQRCSAFRPWFKQTTPIIELDSVGCCYIAPAALYRSGVRYAPTPPAYTEHYVVCQAAKAQGLPVRCDTQIEAVHAYLPDYGEAAHFGGPE